MGSQTKKIVRHLAQPELEKTFTDFVTERPLDLKLRKLTRRVTNQLRTRKARKA